MPRGGRREGAGRKTAWQSGCSFAETTVIRVPKAIKNEVLEIAHRIDAGETISFDSKSTIQENQALKSKIKKLDFHLNNYEQLELLPKNANKDNI